MYAVIATGGKQYRVKEGDVLCIEKIEAENDAVLRFEVLLLGEGEEVKVGKMVEGATVEAKVLEQIRGKKIVVYKYKSKKTYHRKQGHRQPYTKVQITKVG